MEYYNQNEILQKTYDTLHSLIQQYNKHKNDKNTTIKQIVMELIIEHAKIYIQLNGSIFPELLTENKKIINTINNLSKEIENNAIPEMQNPVKQGIR